MAKKLNYMPWLSIIAGVLVLVAPDILRWVVGIYLVVWGIGEWQK